jgi:O-antigen/teichoic acid export membrane protein
MPRTATGDLGASSALGFRHAREMSESDGDRAGSARSRLPKGFGWSAVSNYAAAGVVMAVAFITTPILTRHLGPEEYGIWILVGSTIAYVELLDLGFGGAVVSAVARVSAADDRDGLERTLNTSFFLLLILGAAALLAALLAALVLPYAMHLSGSLERTTQELLLLLGFAMAMSIPMDVFGCGLVALQRYDLLNATLIVVSICEAAAWTVVLVKGGGLLALGIVTVVISLLGQVSRYVLLRRLVPSFSLSPARFDRGLVRSLAGPARWFAMGDTIEAFRDYTSVLVLGAVRNVATSGVFAVGDKLAGLGTAVGTPLAAPLFPHAAALVGAGDTDALGPAARTSSRLITGVTLPSCLVVAVLARPALIAWVGPTYERAAPAVAILAIAFGLRSLGTAAAKFVSGSGGQRLIALTSLAEVTTQVVLSAVLGEYFGITGVAVAILASVVCIELAITLPLLGKRLGTGTVQLVAPVLRTHVPSVAISGTVGWFVAEGPVLHFVNAHGRIAGTSAVAATGVAILLLYSVVLACLGLDGTERQAALAWLRNRRGGPKSAGIDETCKVQSPGLPADDVTAVEREAIRTRESGRGGAGAERPGHGS